MHDKEMALQTYLVAAAKSGDRAAMQSLVTLRGGRLLAHAARLLGDREQARDIVQEAWVEILRGLKGLRDDHAFLPWALQIVSRRVSREIGRRVKDRELARDLGAEANETLPDDAGDKLDAARVRRAIDGLSPSHRATIALFYLEEMTVSEVAQATDVPVGTVKTRLMHARTALRHLLQGEER